MFVRAFHPFHPFHLLCRRNPLFTFFVAGIHFPKARQGSDPLTGSFTFFGNVVAPRALVVGQCLRVGPEEGLAGGVKRNRQRDARLRGAAPASSSPRDTVNSRQLFSHMKFSHMKEGIPVLGKDSTTILNMNLRNPEEAIISSCSRCGAGAIPATIFSRCGAGAIPATLARLRLAR